MRLIPEWRQAWRLASVWAASLLAVVSVLQAEVLPLFQFAVPADRWPWVSAGFGAAIVVLRLVAQSLPEDAAPEPAFVRHTLQVNVPPGVDPILFAQALRNGVDELKARLLRDGAAK